MKSIHAITAVLLCGLSATSAHAAINCIEVQAFTVDRENISSKADARAASIPEPRLEQIQIQLAKELSKKFRGVKIVKTGEDKCEATAETAVISGEIANFQKGNKAARYFTMGLGGAQKIKVTTKISFGDGKEIASKDVSDTKAGGFLGGSDKKGIQDFAEKIADFVKVSLKKK
jgi:hypothetical protein